MNDIESFENEKNRLAAEKNTLPDYLILNNDGTYTDILTIMKLSNNLEEIIETYKKYVNVKDIILNYLAVNSRQRLDNKQISDIAKKNKTYIPMSEISDFNIKKIQKKIEGLIQSNKVDVRQNTVRMKEYDRLASNPINYEEFQEEFTFYTLTIDFKGKSLLELFNSIVLTKNIPFATCQEFFKLLTGFTPSFEWITDAEKDKDSIIVRTHDNNEIKIKGNELSFSLDLSSKLYEDFIQEFFSIFSGLQYEITNRNEKKKGTFLIKDVDFNQYILADIVMNNPIFNTVFYIDDHINTTKERNSIHLLTDRIQTSLSATITQEDTSIKIRISKGGVSSENILKIQRIFNALFNLYKQDFSAIQAEYKKYGANIDYEHKKQKTQSNKKALPDIFVGGYSRFCSHQPSFEKEQEKAEEKAKGNIIKFPKDDENLHYYFSIDEKFPYVGVRKNTLKNSEKYPYIPCCYQTDPSQNEDFLYYYQGIEKEHLEKKTSSIIKGKKAASFENLALLPDKLDSLFKLVSASDFNTTFHRKGVDKSNNSFLQCVMECTQQDSVIIVDNKQKPVSEEQPVKHKDTNQKERLKILTEKRQELAKNFGKLAVCKQEMHDKNLNEISEYLKNEDNYLDPSLFIHLLEEEYNCNILLFNSNQDGSFLIPRHTKEYCKNMLKSRKTLCILENTYTIKSPQCEYIVKFDSKKHQNNIQMLFDVDEIRQIIDVENEMYRKYSIYLKSFSPIFYQADFRKKAKSQFIDCFGKTRILYFETKTTKHKFSLKTEPLQPLYLEQTKDPVVYKLEEEDLRVVQVLQIILTKQRVFKNKTVELFGNIEGFQVSIETNSISILQGVPIEMTEHLFTSVAEKDSVIKTYNKQKKIARCLTECTKWAFFQSKESLESFSKNNFVLIPNHSYVRDGEQIQQQFENNNSFFDDQNRIIVTSIDMKKRLLYVLKLSLTREPEYSNLEHIPNFYMDISDFDIYPNQYVLFKQSSIINFIQTVDFVIYSSFQIQNQPYFLKNENIDKKVYLAQNTENLQKAVNICEFWKTHKINLGNISKESDSSPPKLYIYDSVSNTVSKDSKNKSSTKIVKYETYYVCLLAF